MKRAICIGAVLGAFESLILLPFGLSEAMVVLTPFFALVGTILAATLDTFARFAHRPCERSSRYVFSPSFLDNWFVAGVIAMLILCLVPNVHEARETARRSACKANLIQHSGSHPPILYHGNLDVCPVCTDESFDGVPRPIMMKYDVMWYKSWGDLPESNAEKFYCWSPIDPDESGFWHGYVYVVVGDHVWQAAKLEDSR